jgi:Mor family transcriptional regulator
MSRSQDKLRKLVADLVEIGAAELASLGLEGLDADQARGVATAIAREVCRRNAKTYIYVPGVEHMDRLDRNAEIYAAWQVDGPDGARKFSGARIDQLAAQYGVTTVWIYQVIRSHHEAEVAERQGMLPGIEPA